MKKYTKPEITLRKFEQIGIFCAASGSISVEVPDTETAEGDDDPFSPRRKSIFNDNLIWDYE